MSLWFSTPMDQTWTVEKSYRGITNMWHFPNLTLQTVETLLAGSFLWIFHVSVWVDQISQSRWSERQGFSEAAVSWSLSPRRPWIKPGQETKQRFFFFSPGPPVLEKPCVICTMKHDSGLSSRRSPPSSLQVHWQSVEGLAKGRWLCSPCCLLLRSCSLRSEAVVLCNTNSVWFHSSIRGSKLPTCLQHTANWEAIGRTF